jgi:signal transduction histidine kinase
MHFRLCKCVWLALFTGAVAGAFFRANAEPALHKRVFRSGGSYPSAVSVAPNGTVAAKSGDNVLTVLDGFIPRYINIPEEITYRVRQNRSAQTWWMTSQGLYRFYQADWTHYPLPEVLSFLNTPPHHLRQISFLPAEANHVLVLFPDKLLDFDASSRLTHVLKDASETHLGDFSEIQEGLENSIWVSGTFGVARLQGPGRRLSAQTPWDEFIVPDTNRINSLQRVFESAPGDITCSANNLGSDTRSVLHLRNGRWSSIPLPGEKIREAWRAWDDSVWGFSTVSLFRIDESGPKPELKREPVSGALYDVAVETNGVFWVAAGEGLVRFAPYLWRSPPQFEDLENSVQSLLFSDSGTNIWLSTAAGLVRQSGSTRRAYSWPEELENAPPHELFRLPDGRIMVEGQARPIVFDDGRFERLNTPPALRVHVVGALKDGSVCLWFEHNTREAPLDLRLYKGDQFEKIELPEEKWNRGEVSFVKEAANGDLWICQGASLLRVLRSTGVVEHHGVENGLRTDRVLAFAEVGEGRAWCGTASRIFEYRGQRWEAILNTLDRVTDIVPAQGSIWVSTLSGVQRFQENSWIPYGVKEGLPSGPIFAVEPGPNDQVWAGASRGVFVFHPEADRDPPRAFNPTLDELAKPAAGEPIVVHFRGQDKWDYTFTNDLLFAYRLDEQSWTGYSNSSSHTFPKLAAGSHVIELFAMDRNGNKSPSPGRLEFGVILPWFQDPRLVFVSMVALCTILVLGGLAVNRHFQLKRSYARVGQIVAERTAELARANQELLHGQKMRALGTMAAGIAHDFNNILSIIKGSAQIIENNVTDPEKIHTRVSRIQTVVEQGTVIVKSLLGLGKTEQKDLSDCDIHVLLHNTRKLLSDRFPETVQIQIDTETDLPLVYCAPEVLQQILLNLILNASEAMHNGGMIELSARLSPHFPRKPVLEPEPPEKSATPPRFVLITVKDEGGGISPENLPRIFEPFFTTKAFSTRRGTGLGLSMVYELAKAQGYGIAVETEVGRGSTFTIIVPVLRPKSEAN